VADIAVQEKALIISFDMDGTLLNSKFADSVWLETIPALYAGRKAIDFPLAKQIVTSEYAEIGEERVEWYDINYWLQRFDLNHDWRELLHSCRHNITFYPEAQSVLEKLARDHRLIIISNAAREFLDIETEGLRDYFTAIFSSISDFQQTKKEADSYLRVCNALKIRPEELYHVGDHYTFDYLAPKGVGINAFFLDRHEGRKGEHIVRNLREFEEKVKHLQ
jgi:putative hydrolase of the HAD superfamily